LQVLSYQGKQQSVQIYLPLVIRPEKGVLWPFLTKNHWKVFLGAVFCFWRWLSQRLFTEIQDGKFITLPASKEGINKTQSDGKS